MTCVRGKNSAVCLALLVMVFGSCRQDGDRVSGERNVGRVNESDSGGAAAAVDPLELWQRVRAAYAQAAHYHDDGKLILRYRLNDRPMEEHQLWAIDFDRTGRLAARVFNARLQSDAARTTLRVFDWNSENMDNQVVVHPGFDSELWSRLHQDPVSRHFLMWIGEMPFSSDLDPRQLIPLVARLLQGPAADDWLAEAAAPQSIGRELLDGNELEILTVGWDTERVRLWIDPTACRIVQAELPLSMLEPTLLQSPEISGLRLLARLDNASFEPAAGSEVFSTALPDDCHPVRAFVPLPDRFPSEAIGEPFPSVKLTDRQGATLELDSKGAAGKLFVWIDGTQSSRDVATQIDSLESTAVQSIYLDYQPERAAAAEPNVRARALAALHPDLIQDSTWFDFDNAAGRQLHVPFAPTAVLVDAQGVVQYFQTLLDPGWQKTLQTAIRRVADGEDLAGEMRSEYQAFLDKYRERLTAANPLAAEPVTPSPPAPMLTAVPRLEPIWEFTDVKQPGNLLWSESGDMLFALDGWQTVVALDVPRRQAQRIPLRVDPAVALTRLRRVPGERPSRFVAFADLGTGLYVFDAQWQPLGEFSAAPHLLIDVQMYSSADSFPELVIVDNAQHVRSVNADTLQATSEATVEFASGLAAIPRGARWPKPEWHSLALRADGSSVALNGRLEIVDEFRVPELRLVRIGLANGRDLAALGLALDRRGDWVAVGIDREFQVTWTQPIGTQAFDWQIEPIAHRLVAERDYWAIAGSDSTVTVLDDRGRVQQRWQCSERIHGIAWSPTPSDASSPKLEQANLAISLDTRIAFATVSLDTED